MSDDAEHSCPNIPLFVFDGKCPIADCQFNSSAVTSGCISISYKRNSRVSRSISDKEITYLKFNNAIPAEDIGVMRRKSQTEIKNAILLYYFIEYIESNYYRHKKELDLSHDVEAVLTFSNVNASGHFKPWMLYFMLDSDIFKTFIRSRPEKHNIRSIAQLLDISNCAFIKLSEKFGKNSKKDSNDDK